jgi:hypothetical protein
MKLQVFYRISDAGNPKNKLEGTDKKFCLENALSVFGKDNFHIRADNCSNETLDMIASYGIKPIISSLGNAGSWLATAIEAMSAEYNGDLLYFLEDDYLHLPGSAEAILDGLELADYLSLYDHPDKYKAGENPFVLDGGETSLVLSGKFCHWKSSNSTTMTFAVKQSTFLEDWPIWQKSCEAGYPDDYRTFLKLQSLDTWENRLLGKKRRLITSIPAFATHTETAFLAPHRNWKNLTGNGNF